MPVRAGLELSGVTSLVAQRWAGIDPLLPAPPVQPDGDLLAVPGAAGRCAHWAGEPGSLDLAWGAARQFRLDPLVAGPDVRAGLDRLLTRWRGHLAGLPGTAEDGTAAVLTWPSRDIAGARVLLDHGLIPLAVIAARPAGRGSRPAAAGPGVRIRGAGPADLDSVVALGMETIRYDAHFGTVIERPDSAAALRREAAARLGGAEPWTWLAERDGTPVGLLYAQPPGAAAWIAPLARLAPVAYLELMAVRPGSRGAGVGAALAGTYHAAADDAGIAVTLLHYEQMNPLSGPFWSQQGYRPLWTTWEARPALALR
ncbi:MAG TPA: GNAT family N-acetyltransferase [Streptosporangiaceae bacterium]|nr:GNAT family N-acetyltransferase [Streptosporangiaceae bacterium]